MKKVIMLVMLCSLIFAFTACDSWRLKPVSPCIVDRSNGAQIEFSALCNGIAANGEKSYICDLQKDYEYDACYIHRGLEIAAKEGLILEGYTAKEFEEWGTYVTSRVRGGITFGLLKDLGGFIGKNGKFRKTTKQECIRFN